MAEQANPTNDKTNAPLDELQALRQRLQAAEQQREEMATLARQTRAEFENYQKRFQRDLAVERQYAQSPLASDLLPALDN
ncbi:MAG: nucleotide exchange factor GrpE, partial [Gemmataceae bacterium]